jgi:predicted AAA+ superfamily ATPase
LILLDDGALTARSSKFFLHDKHFAIILGKYLTLVSGCTMKDRIKQIILEWQETEIKDLIQRNYRFDYTEQINSIIGLRRSGKTYLLFLQQEELLKKNIPKSQILFINFEDERLLELKSQDAQLIIDAFYELYPENRNQIVYLFFDEIQNLANWNLFLKRLYERKLFKITITGSSSKLLSSEIATELRGRTRSYQIYPLSFTEFLNFKSFELQQNVEFSSERYKLINFSEEFMKFGGYPRVVLENSQLQKKQILRDYLDMIIYRDIIERYAVRNTHILKLIINYVLSNFATDFSINSFIKKFQGEYSLNKDTIFSYFSYLEDVNFIYFLPRFSHKIHQQYLLKKLYLADNGFLNILSYRGTPNRGKILENLIFSELLKCRQDFFYYRDEKNLECDFIIVKDDRVQQAIQVSYDITTENEARELRGLVSAMTKFNLNEGLIITNDQEREIKVDDLRIKLQPFWKWMLFSG